MDLVDLSVLRSRHTYDLWHFTARALVAAEGANADVEFLHPSFPAKNQEDSQACQEHQNNNDPEGHCVFAAR